MGYYASGSGYASFKKGVDIAEVEAKLDELDVWFDWNIGNDGVNFFENDKYHEDETSKFLDALVPYITEGEATYSGEGDCHWRFRFSPDDQEWIEESGTIDYNFDSYTDEQLIEELNKRGYIVQKKPQND